MKPEKEVISWLIDADPSLRWQVKRDLTLESDEDISAEAIDLVVSKRQKDGLWLLDNPHAIWYTSIWRVVVGQPAAGSHCVLCGCWTGIQNIAEAEHER